MPDKENKIAVLSPSSGETKKRHSHEKVAVAFLWENTV